MWNQQWRNEVWNRIEGPWDIVVIGGGITGAGILREAARHGLHALLIEQRDFAWGTSSRSSKLVHGGLRYLAQGQVRLTWASVRERESLLEDGPGLIDPLGFLMVTNKGQKPGRWTYSAGLSVYDLMALQWSHRHYDAQEFQLLAPYIASENLRGGFRYGDAQTDDARLVLRVLREAIDDGGVALNYVRAERIIREDDRVQGVFVKDQMTGKEAQVNAKVVINATGAWADYLRQQVGAEARIRPLRGSHLIFPSWCLPVPQAVAFLHPLDKRPVFIFPWEGVTLVGTTDMDHDSSLNDEPRISPHEVAYLMAAVQHIFPAREIVLDDVIATYAGVRPVIGTGKEDPSKEAREHVVWQEKGLLTVTGGKLTTFRLIALDTLKMIADQLPEMSAISGKTPVLNAVDEAPPPDISLEKEVWQRLLGRYGADANALVSIAESGELQTIPGTKTVWAELRWAARSEAVMHLDDLLLRRVRIGLLLADGGAALVNHIRAICQPELGWDDARWDEEWLAYQHLWHVSYSLPERDAIPDWQYMLENVAEDDEPTHGSRRPIYVVAGMLALLLWMWRRHRSRQLKFEPIA